MTIRTGDIVRVVDDYDPRIAGKVCEVISLLDKTNEVQVVPVDEGTEDLFLDPKYVEPVWQYTAYISTTNGKHKLFITATNKEEAESKTFGELNGTRKRQIGQQTFVSIGGRWINVNHIAEVHILR